nr:MAG TPA: hypothetical protein [Caudoviricetes sp.]
MVLGLFCRFRKTGREFYDKSPVTRYLVTEAFSQNYLL